MGKHAGAAGITAFWEKIKATFGASVSVSGATISLKNKADTPVILSQATIPDATTSTAGVMSAADKVKIDGVAVGANKTVVDSALSSTSTNPVQNKVINSALAGKAASSHSHADKAPLASPTFTGVPAAPTASAGTASTQIATTAFVSTAIAAAAEPGAGIGVLDAWPVGSVFVAKGSAKNPAALLGGTWTLITTTHLFIGLWLYYRVA